MHNKSIQIQIAIESQSVLLRQGIIKMQGQILRKQEQVNFQPSFHRKQSEQPKPATYRTKSKDVLLSFEEKCLVLERSCHEQQSMTGKHSNQRRDYSLPVFNNNITTRDIPHFSNKFERNYQSPFSSVEVREVRPGLPLKLDLGDHPTSPKKRISSLRVPVSQEDAQAQKGRRGAKVKFIAGLNQTIIEQDSKHQQQQLNLKQTNQFFPLPLINYLSKIDLGHITKQKKPQQILNKKRVSLSLPSIKNRLQRSEQEKISLVCQNSNNKVKQQKQASVNHQISRYEIAGNNQRENEKKILVKKMPKKRRIQIVGHKRMRTEPRIQTIEMQVVSEKKKLSLKYEEQIKGQYQKIEKIYLDNYSDQLQTFENRAIQ